MRVLENLQPARVFSFFEDLCEIPHGSGNTGAVTAYCAEFAHRRNLACESDAAGNVIIKKPASAGYEKAAPVMLQGHLDMVCAQAPGCTKDMAAEGLDLAVEGDFVFARDTTLGGDDGIAAAMMLAVLDDDTLDHPALEAVFTTDEEVGMLGAAALDMSGLNSRRLLNLDSEEEGVFTVSCAGGNRTVCTLPVNRDPMPGTQVQIRITGLAGGHSGEEINQGRASANQLMGRMLAKLEKTCGARLVSVDGGQKDNAIPNECTAVAAAADPAKLEREAAQMGRDFAEEYRTADPGIRVEVVPAAGGRLPMTAISSKCVITFLACAPFGVQAMSADIPDLVQTSLNLGILTTEEDEVAATFSIRSSKPTQKEMLTVQLGRLAEALGGRSEVSSDYPAWEYKKDSALREQMEQVFFEQYGKKPQVKAIHAGLECGLFSGKLPGLDCVSFGPDLAAIHTFREKMSISSVQRVWTFLLEVLRRSK